MEEQLGFRRVVTYTTRPPRPGEKEGEDYCFVSDVEFDALEKSGYFLETTSYSASFGDCKYGTPLRAFQHDDNLVVVLNLDGAIKFYEQKLGELIYLHIDKATAKKRAILRGDDLVEFDRRFKAECKDYFDKRFYNYVDRIWLPEHLARFYFSPCERMFYED